MNSGCKSEKQLCRYRAKFSGSSEVLIYFYDELTHSRFSINIFIGCILNRESSTGLCYTNISKIFDVEWKNKQKTEYRGDSLVHHFTSGF